MSASKIDLAKAKKRKRAEHWLSSEQVLGFQSVKDWLSKLPEPKSKDTADDYVWGMQIYTDFTGKSPDDLIVERNTELGSRDLLVRTTAERSADRFMASYPKKSSALQVVRAVQSFYKKHRMALQSITVPDQDSITVRLKDRIPTDKEIRQMCDNSDLRDRLVILVGAQTGMRIGSEVLLQYKHLKEDLEAGLIPCKVKVPQYEREYDKLGSMTFICGDTISLLKDYLEARKRKGEVITDESWVFPRNEGNPEHGHLQDAGVWKLLRREARKVGLIGPDEGGITEFRFHCFRKRFKTILEGIGTPLSWVDLMMCHLPRGAEGQAYTRPHEDELREWYSKTVPRLLVYGRPPDLATVEDVDTRFDLRYYWRGIEDSPLKVKSPEEVLKEEESERGRPLSMNEQIEVLREEYQGLLEGLKTLMDDSDGGHGRKVQKVIPESELAAHLDEGWEYLDSLPSGKVVVRK